MNKNASLFLPFFPLQLAAIAGVLAAFSALLAQVPPVTVIVRTLLAVLVFALLGQLLDTLWQRFNTPSQVAPPNPAETPESAEQTATDTLSIPAYPAGAAVANALPFSQSLESPKAQSQAQVVPLSSPISPPQR